ncbi:unnamed protein product [Miscanthus lutarioriparius]|uniref:Uncharacterized protein n=1 Tax=Miscanthus lutarioriparius TaxID=422564 RepID=A0A811R003_9POAL|nr:unnamed protein product [Miscanthus lutarioriparius]
MARTRCPSGGSCRAPSGGMRRAADNGSHAAVAGLQLLARGSPTVARQGARHAPGVLNLVLLHLVGVDSIFPMTSFGHPTVGFPC